MTNTPIANPLIAAMITATRALADFESGDESLDTLEALHDAEEVLMIRLDEMAQMGDFHPERELGNNICELIQNAIQ